MLRNALKLENTISYGRSLGGLGSPNLLILHFDLRPDS
jgi:hypothetical protein